MPFVTSLSKAQLFCLLGGGLALSSSPADSQPHRGWSDVDRRGSSGGPGSGGGSGPVTWNSGKGVGDNQVVGWVGVPREA